MTMRGIAWLLVLVTASSLAAPASAPMMIGENIYRHGVLSTGEPLRGERAAASGVQGAAAACANCHRRSGLGEVEGVTLIPPITAKYLYSQRRAWLSRQLKDATPTTAPQSEWRRFVAYLESLDEEPWSCRSVVTAAGLCQAAPR